MSIDFVLYLVSVHPLRQHGPRRPFGEPRPSLLCWIVLLAWAATASPAAAAIAPATLLDGPSSSILEIDGAAMAPDGTGGVVYRKLVDGEPHVFVSRLVNGTFQPPIQVDTGQLGPATFPAIAAADGGELLVVWVQPWEWISSSPGAQATLHYALMSAVLQPGAQSFGQIERIDDVGDGTAAYPSLSMAPDGSAYVAYRVVTNPLAPGTNPPITPMRPGDELIEVRAQRFNGLGWSSLGTMNRLPGQVTMRRPTASNAPVIAVNDSGQAVIVWQEPEINGVARIWARRLSGVVKGNVLEASPASIAGKPVTAEAEAPALALGEFGEAKVAFRLAGGPGSPLGSAQVMINTLTAPVVEEVSSFSGPVALDGASSIGVPSVALDAVGEYRLGYTSAGTSRLISGREAQNRAPTTLGAAGGEQVLTTVAPGGGGVSAWLTTSSRGLPVVEARQDFPGDTYQRADLSAPLSGPITGLVAGQSGLGDELIAFDQGPAGSGQIMASLATSPPGAFSIHVPSGWLNARSSVVEWQPAANAVGALTYSVLVDGRVVARGLPGFSYKFNPHQLGDGVRHIEVVAIDAAGQQTMSAAALLHAETNPPLVSVQRLSHDRVRVRVYGDPAGIKAADTLVSFGDGATSRRQDTVVHTYRRPDRYTIVVHVTDRVGNYRDAHVLVRIP